MSKNLSNEQRNGLNISKMSDIMGNISKMSKLRS